MRLSYNKNVTIPRFDVNQTISVLCSAPVLKTRFHLMRPVLAGRSDAI